MKKFLVLLAAFTMAIGLSACSSNSSTAASSEPKQADVQKGLVNFYTNLYNTINEKDADLNTYEDLASKKVEDPTIKIDAEQKAKASSSAAAVAAYLKSVQVPAVLKAQKADLDEAIKMLAASYQMKAVELDKVSPNLDAANTAFTQADNKIGAVFETVKLFKPTLAKQVN